MKKTIKKASAKSTRKPAVQAPAKPASATPPKPTAAAASKAVAKLAGRADGVNSGELAKHLGCSSSDAGAVLRAATASGALTKTGVTKSTRYFAKKAAA